MTKIFKHLAKHWAACLVIIALLLVQAYGDLTLPDYTSKIVDTGIQQSGIADAVPEVVRDSTLQVLELLMTDADAAAVEAAYTQPGGTDNALASAASLQKKLASPDTVRLLRADADRDTLAEVFSTPDIVLYLASAQAAGEGNAPDAAALDTVTAQFAAMTQMPGFSRDAVQAQLAAAMGQAGESELSGLSAQAVLLVGLEYQALGISDAVQMNYLMHTGGRMLGLTLLMVAAAVLVGLLASRVAAAIARDLRRGVFLGKATLRAGVHKVVHHKGGNALALGIIFAFSLAGQHVGFIRGQGRGGFRGSLGLAAGGVGFRRNGRDLIIGFAAGNQDRTSCHNGQSAKDITFHRLGPLFCSYSWMDKILPGPKLRATYRFIVLVL